MVVGIDLGTTNTRACYFMNGKKKLLKFTGGATMLPSVIYTDEDGKVIVGQGAQSREASNPSRTIRLDETSVAPFEVATEILKEVRRRLVRNMRLNENEEISAVITVPVLSMTISAMKFASQVRRHVRFKRP